ncbi:hypothetical protein GQX62_05385 [Brachyspira hyodysenteriae]|uniref:hypothetical protein n=1 Tax=Brachyspira hyodysenteriae TaxID=159 RepID=UPI001ADD7C25|nr:hypothetical protein [Brachyspira hyodysenteriae]QTM03086.1 hypothetical protein GQX62_05385 [Brachyspira hyodysenteriae]
MEKEFFDIQLMIKNIYEIINIYLNSGGNVCELSIDFYNKDSKPDYNKPQVQSSYLLKYALGYSFEYYYMYDHIEPSFQNRKEINILSLGCGSCIDYWSLCLLLYRRGKDLKINYIGVDKIKWNSNNIRSIFDKNNINTFKFTKRKFDSCYFIENEINMLHYDDIFDDRIINILNNLDVIIFPRSIGEILIDETNNINIENINIIRDIISHIKKYEIYILSSIYSTNHYNLLDELSKTYYSENLDSNFEDKGICGIDNYFEYPKDIKRMYTNLCEYYTENDKDNRCNKGINKNCRINNDPILYASKLKYRIKKIILW